MGRAAVVVRWEPGWRSSDFLGAVMKAGGLAPGSVVFLEYLHDQWCPKLSGGACRCDPDVTATVTPAPEAA